MMTTSVKAKMNALYYPETICLNETELKYLLLLYDKIFFLPLDNQLNPGHTNLSKRFSIYDGILTGAFKSEEDAYYAQMYSSEPIVWDGRMKRLMDLYDELEDKGIVVGLREEQFATADKWHPLKDAVSSDMKDKEFVSSCIRHQKKKIYIKRIEDAIVKGGGLRTRPPKYKNDLFIPSICSERLNTTLFIAGRDNLFPVCGNSLYVELLKTKLKRPSAYPQEYPTPPNSSHRFSFLSWEIATEVVPQNIIRGKSTKELLQYKSACIDIKQKFRDHLWSLEASISSEPWEETLPKEIDRIVKQEIIPEIDKMREQKIIIWEKLFGQTLSLSVKIVPALLGVQLIIGLSFWDILALSIGGAAIKPLLNSWQEERDLRRNALFFLVRLQK